MLAVVRQAFGELDAELRAALGAADDDPRRLPDIAERIVTALAHLRDDGRRRHPS